MVLYSAVNNFYCILAVRYSQVPVSVDPTILQRLKTVKERLRDAEFLNSARSQELISLKAELAKVIAQNAKISGKNKSYLNNSFLKSVTDSSLLSLPSIYNQMPHLLDSSDSLVPSLQVSKDRVGGKKHLYLLLFFLKF